MTVPTRRPRAALYARTSTARDQSPALQLDELHAVAQRRGWDTVDFVDHGQSGARDRRPELDRLMAEARAGRLDLVACWRFDRFARSVRHLVTALEEFRALGIDFVSVRDGIDTLTPMGRFTFHLVAAVAELEREVLRERTSAGLAAAKRRGVRLGRPRVHVDLGRARALLAQGKSIRLVAKNLRVGDATLRRALAAASKTSVDQTS